MSFKTLNRKTIAELRSIARDLGLETGGSKQQLIGAIEEHRHPRSTVWAIISRSRTDDTAEALDVDFDLASTRGAAGRIILKRAFGPDVVYLSDKHEREEYNDLAGGNNDTAYLGGEEWYLKVLKLPEDINSGTIYSLIYWPPEKDIEGIEMSLYTTGQKVEAALERRARKLDLLGPGETLADKIDMTISPDLPDGFRVDRLTLPTPTGIWLLIDGPYVGNVFNYTDFSKINVKKFASRKEAAKELVEAVTGELSSYGRQYKREVMDRLADVKARDLNTVTLGNHRWLIKELKV